MLKKVCGKCKEELDVSEFGKDKYKKDGLNHKCKACYKIFRKVNKEKISKRSKQYYQSNKEQKKLYYESNIERRLKGFRLHYQNNKERFIEAAKQYRKNNPDIINSISAKKRASKLQRTVGWANTNTIREIYKDCIEINLAAKAAGCTETFHVDHIVPLQGKNVSGLHVENNLQIITATENLSKGNKFIT